MVDEIQTHKVITNSQGAYDATIHLIRKNYKNIANISNATNLLITKSRIEGYKKALKDNGLKINEDLIQYCPHGGLVYEEVELALDKLFALNKKLYQDLLNLGFHKKSTDILGRELIKQIVANSN